MAGWQALALSPDGALPQGRLEVPPVWQVPALWLP
jgi:hypothetical protein